MNATQRGKRDAVNGTPPELRNAATCIIPLRPSTLPRLAQTYLPDIMRKTYIDFSYKTLAYINILQV